MNWNRKIPLSHNGSWKTTLIATKLTTWSCQRKPFRLNCVRKGFKRTLDRDHGKSICRQGYNVALITKSWELSMSPNNGLTHLVKMPIATTTRQDISLWLTNLKCRWINSKKFEWKTTNPYIHILGPINTGNTTWELKWIKSRTLTRSLCIIELASKTT